MKIMDPPRGPERRKADVLARLESELDIWVASASADGAPCLVPLWFVWHDGALWLSTVATNPTGRNLRDTGRARLALGHTRDVVIIDGAVETFTAAGVPAAAAEAFQRRTGWDPRGSGKPYAYFQVRPESVQAWHEERELKGRHIMRDGAWVV
ncbi:pyridoxamine 5'-phosphate oxidase family protein [Streptomyces sp. NPDC051173]|uniref:pyridoxamine 5'-phosphate oxidase family protein n=1 Tax=Streptomyces sp. NPDC051173 TaxID=3155164 RepID=UPI00344F572E